jgi:glutathione S-transferase
MLKLFGHVSRLSTNTLKLRVALGEAGATYEYVGVDLAAGEQRKPEFLALNPHGKIPVLVHDDFVLPESDAILWYIAETFPQAHLLGATPRERARALEWCDFTSSALYPGYADVYMHTSYLAPEKRNPATAESGRVKLGRALGVLDQVLGQRVFLAGSYSLADIAAASVVRTLKDRLPDTVANCPHVNSWFDRVTARAAWQEALSTPSSPR